MIVLFCLFNVVCLLLVLFGVGVGLNLCDVVVVVGVLIFVLFMFYGGSLLDNVLVVLLVLFLVVLLCLCGVGLMVSLGLYGNGWCGLLWVLLVSLFCWLGLVVLGMFNIVLIVFDVMMFVVLFLLVEEVLFRGFGFVLVVKFMCGLWFLFVLL